MLLRIEHHCPSSDYTSASPRIGFHFFLVPHSCSLGSNSKIPTHSLSPQALLPGDSRLKQYSSQEITGKVSLARKKGKLPLPEHSVYVRRSTFAIALDTHQSYEQGNWGPSYSKLHSFSRATKYRFL